MTDNRAQRRRYLKPSPEMTPEEFARLLVEELIGQGEGEQDEGGGERSPARSDEEPEPEQGN